MKMKPNEFYDVKTKERVSVDQSDIKKNVDKRGRSRLVARHPVHGHLMYKYV